MKKDVYYFAYGANMEPAVLDSNNIIKPRKTSQNHPKIMPHYKELLEQKNRLSSRRLGGDTSNYLATSLETLRA